MREVVIAVLIVFIVAPPSGASILNGGFENGTNPPTSGFITLAAASTAIEGWTVGDGTVDWIGNYWQPAGGSRSVDLAGNGAGTITTTFATTPGQQYTVTFFLSGNYDGNREQLTRTANVSVNGGDPLSFVFRYFDGWSRSNMGWVQQAFSFTAAGNSTTLAFSSGEGSSPYGPAIDSVNVVPIPAAVWLLASGLVGLVAIRRRRAG